MPRLFLILMVKNEGKIIERCMKSVEGVVDAYVITDTGSSDNTTDIALDFLNTHEGCLEVNTWENFGHNRTLSFQNAQGYCRKKGWDMKNTYGLLLDADMEFAPGTLKDQALGEVGYTLLQLAGTLEYPNTRLVRMDYEWVCRGVTHEYWDGQTQFLDKKIGYINDHNDGGCKSDKFPRDLALLMKGLDEDPTNVRYMFYIAQTYHCMEKWTDAIKWYTKRIDSGGWFEEVWYSMYMIAKTYMALNNTPDAEHWVQKAYEFRSSRSEALYHLCKYLRIKGECYKAMHYIQLGKKIPITTDALFIERDVYDGLFDYEETIVRFYVQNSILDGLKLSMKYLLTRTQNNDNVYTNLPFYIDSLNADISPYPVIHDLFGFDYHPSSVSVCGNIHNVRFVNYAINQTDGSYMMKNGKYSADNNVRTQNAVSINGVAKRMNDASVTMPRRDSFIKGLEDVRIYRNARMNMSFIAASFEFSEKIRIVRGKYDLNGEYSDCVVVNSPTDQECEKNWIPIDMSDDVIYRWHPMEIGTFHGSDIVIHTKYTTPWIFKHFRGSASPVMVGNEYWTLVHFVEYSTPRKYFHCFVILDETYKPKRVSTPFVFRQKTIEYCLGITMKGLIATCFVSTMDDNPVIVTFDTAQLGWLQV